MDHKQVLLKYSKLQITQFLPTGGQDKRKLSRYRWDCWQKLSVVLRHSSAVLVWDTGQDRRDLSVCRPVSSSELLCCALTGVKLWWWNNEAIVFYFCSLRLLTAELERRLLASLELERSFRKSTHGGALRLHHCLGWLMVTPSSIQTKGRTETSTSLHRALYPAAVWLEWSPRKK